MSRSDTPCFSTTLAVRDTCLCLHLQRAARAVARRFDEAFRPFGLTNGQFSLLMSLNRPGAARIGDVAALLAMDRTTLTAAAKPLQRRGFVSVEIDGSDRRGRRLVLTPAGKELLAAALPVWRREQAALDSTLPEPEKLRAALRTLA